MCYACWIENGRAAAVGQSTLQAAGLINRLYACEGGEAGGALHIALDGWNVWDRCLAYCREVLDGRRKRYASTDPTLLLAERDVLECLEELSLLERYTALALSEDLIPMPASVFEPRRRELRSHRPHPGSRQAGFEGGRGACPP